MPSSKLEDVQTEVEHLARISRDANEFMNGLGKLIHERLLKYNWVGFYMLEPGAQPLLDINGAFLANLTNQIAVALDNHNGVPGSVKIINSASGASEGNIEDWSGGGPFALCFSSDGSTLVAVGGRGGQPGVAKVWDARSGKITPVSWPQPKHLLMTAALSPDGRLLMTNDDCNARVWDLREKKLVFRMSKDTEELVEGVAFSPNGKMAAAVCSRFSWESDAPGLLFAWNTSDWSETKRMPVTCGARHIAFSPDSRSLAATRHDNTVSVWNTSDWSLTNEYLPMAGYIAALSYSSDGHSLAAATFEDGFSTWQSPAHKR
jgi:WD40 repeat protein